MKDKEGCKLCKLVKICSHKWFYESCTYYEVPGKTINMLNIQVSLPLHTE